MKKQIREGKIKGKPKDLIRKYDEKTANKIQAYQNWYEFHATLLSNEY